MVKPASWLALLALVATATADGVTMQMAFEERDGVVTVATSVTRLFDAASFDRLDAGFPTTVAIRLDVMRQDTTRPERTIVLKRQAIYDMWDEQYVVTASQGGQQRTQKTAFRAEALRLLTDIKGIAVGTTTQLPPHELFFVRVIANLNPITPDAAREARGWLSAGSGGGMDRGGSLFGSVVSVFVRPDINRAYRTMTLTSQPFYRTGTL